MNNSPMFRLLHTFIVLITLCLFSPQLIAQKPTDSTKYYYQSITNFKDVKLFGRAYNYFKNKAREAELNSNPVKAAYYLEIISYGQFKIGFYNESESTTINALRFLDAEKDQTKTIDARVRLYNQLGMIYRKNQDYENSNIYYEKSLKLNKKPEDDIAIITNIGNNYADQNEFQKAVEVLLSYYDEALNISGDRIKFVYLDNLGFYQSKLNLENALINMTSALKYRSETNDLIGLFSSFRHLSLYYFNQNNFKMARKYADSLHTIANKISTPIYKLEALKTKLIQTNNSEFEQFISTYNAIEKEKFHQENKYAAIKYKVSENEKLVKEKEQRLKVIALEKDKEKTLKLFYLTLGILIAILSIFLIFVLKSKYKKEKIQQVYLTETRISKKVHDEVANDVFQVMTKLQNTNNRDDDILDDLDAIYAKTRDISKENSTIDLQGNYIDALKDLWLGYQNPSVNIIAHGLNKIAWEQLDNLKKMTLYRVIQELLVNMKKHSNATNVVLSFKSENKKLHIIYSDNGNGCSIKKGSGLTNMENRMEAIHGSIIFESEPDKGFKAKITV